MSFQLRKIINVCLSVYKMKRVGEAWKSSFWLISFRGFFSFLSAVFRKVLQWMKVLLMQLLAGMMVFL